MTGLGPFFILGLGITLGLQHAFETDHISAVNTQISKIKSKHTKTGDIFKNYVVPSSVMGALWGAGHTTTLVLVGFLVYLLAINIQSYIFTGFEFAAGLMLVFLGIFTFFDKRFNIPGINHRHPHQHVDGTMHFDEHDHNDSNHKHGHKSYLIGLIHGLAGSGSLVALSVITMENPWTILGFILVFGVGSVIGMMIVGNLLGLSIAIFSKVNGMRRVFRFVASAFSVMMGMHILYEVRVLNNLIDVF